MLQERSCAGRNELLVAKNGWKYWVSNQQSCPAFQWSSPSTIRLELVSLNRYGTWERQCDPAWLGRSCHPSVLCFSPGSETCPALGVCREEPGMRWVCWAGCL